MELSEFLTTGAHYIESAKFHVQLHRPGNDTPFKVIDDPKLAYVITVSLGTPACAALDECTKLTRVSRAEFNRHRLLHPAPHPAFPHSAPSPPETK